MRYTVVKSVVHVLGKIWMPAIVCGQTINLRDYDLENMRDDDGKITRESVELWLGSHTGDFSSIIDFSVSISFGSTDIEIPWESEENEMQFSDCMHGDEE